MKNSFSLTFDKSVHEGNRSIRVCQVGYMMVTESINNNIIFRFKKNDIPSRGFSPMEIWGERSINGFKKKGRN